VDREASQKRGEDKTYVQDARDHAISEQHRDCVSNWRLLGKNVKGRLVQMLDDAGNNRQGKAEKTDGGAEVNGELARAQRTRSSQRGCDRQREPQDHVF